MACKWFNKYNWINKGTIYFITLVNIYPFWKGKHSAVVCIWIKTLRTELPLAYWWELTRNDGIPSQIVCVPLTCNPMIFYKLLGLMPRVFQKVAQGLSPTYVLNVWHVSLYEACFRRKPQINHAFQSFFLSENVRSIKTLCFFFRKIWDL